jgi:hypothetical protein
MNGGQTVAIFPAGLGGTVDRSFSGGDPADWLEEEISQAAADRLRALRQHASDCRQMLPDSEELRALYAEKGDHERRKAELLTPAGLGGKGLPEDNRSVLAVLKQLTKVSAEIKRQTDLSEIRSGRWRNAGQLARRVEEWLRDGVPSGCVIREYPAVAVSDVLKKGESIADAVERLKHRRRELKADLHRINSTPFPSADAKAKMRAQIDALAAAGEPYVGSVIEHFGDVGFPTRQMSALVHNSTPGAIAITDEPDAIGLMMWLFRDEIVARLERAIDANADDANALSEQQRQVHAAEIGDSMLMIERQLAALVFHAQGRGENVEHDVDADVRALLGIELIAEARALPSGSSPEHTGWGRR